MKLVVSNLKNSIKYQGNRNSSTNCYSSDWYVILSDLYDSEVHTWESVSFTKIGLLAVDLLK